MQIFLYNSTMIGLLIVGAILAYIAYFYYNVSRYPKGPFPLPFIGNLHQVPLADLHKYMHETGKQYDHCFTLFLPGPKVIFTNYANIKEALVDKGELFIGRSHAIPETLMQKEPQTGILIADGTVWREQRRASLRILRQFGLGKNIMEEQVNRSIAEMTKQIDETNEGQSMDMTLPIQLCVGNIINETLFGYHFKYNDSARLEHFLDKIRFHLEYVTNSKCILLLQAWPWLSHLPFIGKYGRDVPRNSFLEYQTFIESEVEIIKSNYDANSEPTNFVEAYLQEMEKNPQLDIRNLYAVVVDFWLAGMETTGTTLRWALLFLMKYTDAKMRAELLSVTGPHRAPSMADKPLLPYFVAVIAEIQRSANMIPFLAYHRCTEDSTIGGKFIPSGTLTMPQIASVLWEDEVFDNPKEFRPERFLEADGKTLNKKAVDRLIAFGMGKRVCAGEGLARMELFLILGTLLHKYRFEATSPVDLTPIFGAVLVPRQFTCRVLPVV